MTEDINSIFVHPWYSYISNDDSGNVFSILKLFISIISDFTKYYDLTVEYNAHILLDIINKANRDLKIAILYDDDLPNIYCQASILASWIARLKPIISADYKINLPNYSDNISIF